MSDLHGDSLDGCLRMGLRDMRGLSDVGAVHALRRLYRMVRAKSDPASPKHAERHALLRQAARDLRGRGAAVPSAEELASWVGGP